MINDLAKFNEAVEKYCAELPGRWKGEKYKWEAAKKFQDNFDINSANLADNLNQSITSYMMAGTTAPRNMLINLARHNQNGIKQALTELFDESSPLTDRINKFLNDCEIINSSTSYPTSGQNINSTTELLSLKYPNSVFGYRLWIFKGINEYFEMGYSAKKNNQNKVSDSMLAQEEIRNLLINNDSFKLVIASQLTPTCFVDANYVIATSDFCFWVAKFLNGTKEENEDGENKKDEAINYWWVTTNRKEFNFVAVDVGSVVQFNLKNPNGRRKKIVQNFDAVKAGDLVIWYEATPTLKIVGLASVDYPSNGTAIGIKLNKKLNNPLPIKEAEKSPIFLNSQPCRSKYQGTLFLLTKEEYSNLYSLIKGINSDLDDLAILPEPTTETSIFEVYYGIPGCGKSYSLNERLATDGYDEIVRTVFYPEYSNADFVGQLMPQKHGGNMDFVVKPGPFARALALAFSKPNKKVALVIEEINRGNASAIFGEIFQLLDVVNNQNRSQYSIFSPVLTEYLKEKCQIDLEEVYIPGNLSIFGTMNTSDQNVFKFDTAFKRRWKMHRLTNDNGGFDPTQHDFDVPNLNIKWSEFVKKINDAILKNDLEEDRQLGLWFYQENKNDKDLAKSFGEKVLEYLWNDVTKYNHEILFNKDIKSFDELLKMYFDTAKSKEIFNEEILK